MKNRMKSTTVADVIRHFMLAWLMASVLEYLLIPMDLLSLEKLTGLAAMSFPRLLLVTVGLTGILWGLSLFFQISIYERWAIPAVFALHSALALAASFRWALLVACLAIFAVMVIYALRGYDHQVSLVTAPQKVHWGYPVAVAVLALAFFAAVCAWTVGRYRAFCTPNYDFGIFAQMFHSMKEIGLPMTTVERDGLLSHFAVHVSPIYYLMLPFYCLFPDPATLQVLQAAVLASAVIPLWLIGKQNGLSGVQRSLLCALLLLLPATAGGTSYDIHENCFLLPLILWLMYAIDRRNAWLTALFALLTLMVKEDAAVYVAVAGIYLILRTALRYRRENRRDLITGICVLSGAVVWFLLVTGYLATYGDGVMTGRYRNFDYEGSGSLITVIKAVLLSPMKMLFECTDTEKLRYLVYTMAPLLGLPLLTRKYERYILLIPYVLVNLMPDYTYQHDIMFQYNFGSTAFLIYLTAVNLADWKNQRTRLIALGLAVAVSFGAFCTLIVPKIQTYSTRYSKNEDYYTSVRETLDTIPDGASVVTHTFYGAYLSDREVLYDIRYCSQEHLLSAEYVVLKETDTAEYKKYEVDGEDGYENLIALLEENGYVLDNRYESAVVIYRKQQ